MLSAISREDGALHGGCLALADRLYCRTLAGLFADVIMRVPIAFRTCLARQDLGGAAAMIVSVPCLAPIAPPDTGASTKSCPAAVIRAAILSTRSG